MLLTYQRTNPTPLTGFGNLTPGYPEYQGQRVTREARASQAFFRQVARRYRQPEPVEWAMLDGAIPFLMPGQLQGAAIKARISGLDLARWQRRLRQPDFIATVGPGLSARPPFTGIACRPRWEARDLLRCARRFRQVDPFGALSGSTSRPQGSFVGGKLGFLTVEPTRGVVNFTIQPTRTGTLTVQ